MTFASTAIKRLFWSWTMRHSPLSQVFGGGGKMDGKEVVSFLFAQVFAPFQHMEV